MSLRIYKSEKLALAVLMYAGCGMGIVIGMSYPLVTLLLERKGFSASMIGINSAMGSLGILMVGLLSARLLGRHGAFRSIIGAATLGAGSLLALPFIDQVAGWFFLRFTTALGLGFMWLLSESWLNMISTDKTRGSIIGTYAAFFFGGFALGPLIVSATGSQGTGPFVIAASLVLAAVSPMLLLATRKSSTVPRPVPRLELIGLAPFVFLIVFAAGLFEMTAYALLPIYTLRQGLTETNSLYALSAFCGGGIAFQYPLGRLADFAGRRTLILIGAIGILACLLTLPVAIGQMTFFLPLLFVWGGMVFGLYTSGLIMLGDRFSAEKIVAANALFIIFYEAGALFGPTIAGGAMDLWPRHGFIGFLLLMATLLTVLTLLHRLFGKSRKIASPS